ncbi:transcription factor bHLH118-like [Bidens hawaiensis]|uniref:transcription factor bHLH118-like n=1 Tax=Bidens hawaiensis TaxID=980011 RepID=UPI00404B4BF7
MFSFQHSDDLVFHQINIPLISFQQQATNQQDLVVKVHDHVPMEGSANSINPVTKARKLQGGQSPSSKPNSATTDQGVELEDSKDEHTQRKLAHREIERQRRRDMAELFASLRGLLPLEFVKGKRSTSDHMHQAVNYIKHMQENIKVLSAKRDSIKKFVEAGVPGPVTNTKKEDTTDLLPNTVSISSFGGGVQIVVDSCLIEDGFPLSRVLKAISEEGYNVISCSCTNVKQRLIHSIQSEVNDNNPVSTDLSVLQQRLSAVANNY